MVTIKLEQKIVGVYSVIGAVCGVLSDYLTSFSLLYAFILPAAIYVATLFPFMKVVKEKGVKKFALSGFVTFFLLWITVWIFFHNL